MDPIKLKEWEDTRIVQQDKLKGLLVSTVNYVPPVAADYGLNDVLGGPWETMIFAMDDAGDVDYGELYVQRYRTREEAHARHKEIVKKIQESALEGDALRKGIQELLSDA